MKRLYRIVCLTWVLSCLMSVLVLAPVRSAWADEGRERLCRDLPPVAWDNTPKASVTVIIPWRLDRVVSAKELYLQAACGANDAHVWALIERGEGGVVEIPEPLAKALDKAIPHLPPVHYMYVRGGGADREAVVILFADGFRGPFFDFDREIPWTKQEAEHAAMFWNALPYEFMRRASTWLHDAAKFDQSFTVHTELFGSIEIPFYTQQGGRALANPMGTVFVGASRSLRGPNPDNWHGPEIWVHELGHYNHYYLSNIKPLAYTDAFGSISRRNARFLGIHVPFFFKELYQEAADEGEICADGYAEPFGYVTTYARCGETPVVEDFADTLTVAMGATGYIQRRVAKGDEFFRHYNRVGGSGPFLYSATRLYERDGLDANILGAKAQFVLEQLRVHDTLPQDADFDEVAWLYGHDSIDCDDRNPVEGSCEIVACRSDVDCDDQDACTDQSCSAGECVYTIVDSDGDGSTDGECGGSDCDDDNPSVMAGSRRPCSSECGAQGTQLCAAGFWGECDAPKACDCAPGDSDFSSCGMCGVTQRMCLSTGAWDQAGSCQGEGACFAGDERTVSCSPKTCSGRTIARERVDACGSGCQWSEGACRLVEPLRSEVCNGLDDNCSGGIDERCPSPVSPIRLSTPTTSPYFGHGSRKHPQGRLCAPDEAVVGFAAANGHYRRCVLGVCGSSRDVVYSIAPICAKLKLTHTTQADGSWRYALSTQSTRRLSSIGEPYTSLIKKCPTGQVVKGVHYKQGDRFDRLSLRCADVSLTGSIGSYGLSVGGASWTSSPLPSAGPTPNTYDCPTGKVMSGLRGHTKSASNGGEALNVGFDCATPSLSLQ